jgi:hypothetical protein
MTAIKDEHPVPEPLSGDPRPPFPAASASQVEEHVADRWNRGIAAAEQRSAVGRRSLYIMLTVLGAGVLGWLLLTL